MNGFKIGDIVELVDDADMSANAGDQAEVIGFEKPFVQIKWLCETEQDDGGYFPQQFRLVSENRHPWADVIKAWADGRTVQSREPFETVWVDHPPSASATPYFGVGGRIWRIKPKTVKKWHWAYKLPHRGKAWSISRSHLTEDEAMKMYGETEYQKLEFTERVCEY